MLTHELQLKFLSLNKRMVYLEKQQDSALLLFSIGIFAINGSSKAKVASAENPHETIHEHVRLSNNFFIF